LLAQAGSAYAAEQLHHLLMPLWQWRCYRCSIEVIWDGDDDLMGFKLVIRRRSRFEFL
jgi:hypothetical protein